MRRGCGIYREVNKRHEQQHAHGRVVYMRETGMYGTLKQMEDGPLKHVRNVESGGGRM